jgi:hypothetical protein
VVGAIENWLTLLQLRRLQHFEFMRPVLITAPFDVHRGPVAVFQYHHKTVLRLCMHTFKILETGAAAFLFAAAFLAGGRVRPARALIPDRRSIISFGAGMSAAYA